MIHVHLIRTKDVTDEFYDHLATLLNNFPGPLRFVIDKDYQTFLLNEDEITDEEVLSQGKFFQAKEDPLVFNTEQSEELSISHLFPPKIRVATWDTLFNFCRSYRDAQTIADKDFVILLTGLNNEHNWFSAADQNEDNNLFIHTDQWDYFGFQEPRFPVAYLIATGIIKKLAFGNYAELVKWLHHDPKGCISDLCLNKEEIILKMRTADICHSCMEVIRNKISDKTIILQVYRIMDHIQNQLRFRLRFDLLQQPSRIVINPANEPLQFLDIDNSTLRLSPIQKTIFILFLENPDGIFFNRIDEHRDRIGQIYDQAGHNFTLANKKNTLDKITDQTENRLSETISQIRKKLNDHLGNELARNYYIDGPNGGAKKIMLNRELVIWNAFKP